MTQPVTITSQKRFVRRGVSKFYFLIAMAGAEPTRSELTGGSDVTKAVADVSGWSLENQKVDTPDMGTTFDSGIPGNDQAKDSSLVLYEDKVKDDLEGLFAKDTAGWVVIMRKGDTPASMSMDVFPVRVGSKSPEYSAGNDPARFTVMFTITDEPTLDAPVPAASP